MHDAQTLRHTESHRRTETQRRRDAAKLTAKHQPFIDVQVLPHSLEISGHLLNRDVKVLLHVLVVVANRRLRFTCTGDV